MDPVPTSSDPMGGRLAIEINGVTIPSFMLGEVSASVSQILRTSERLSGTSTTPTHMLDNPQFDVTFFPNKWSDLQYFMPDNMDGETFVAGMDECSIPDPTEVKFVYECEDGDTRTITVPVARVSFEDSSSRTQTDDLSVMIHIFPQPNALGQVQYGAPITS